MVAGYAVGGGHILHMVCDLTVRGDKRTEGLLEEAELRALVCGTCEENMVTHGRACSLLVVPCIAADNAVFGQTGPKVTW